MNFFYFFNYEINIEIVKRYVCEAVSTRERMWYTIRLAEFAQ